MLFCVILTVIVIAEYKNTHNNRRLEHLQSTDFNSKWKMYLDHSFTKQWHFGGLETQTF